MEADLKGHCAEVDSCLISRNATSPNLFPPNASQVVR
jgi:hypothetical protein